MVAAQTLLLALAVSGTEAPVLLQFSAQWCGPCQAMQPVVRRLAAEGYHIQKVDVDKSPELATRYRINGLPSFVMLSGGREVDRVVGAASFARLRQMFHHAGPREAAVVGGTPENAGRYQAAAATPRGAEEKPATSSTTIDKAMRATVRIKVEDPTGHGYGTGTVIDVHGPEALVVTCGHIFRDSKGKGPISIETFDGAAARPGQLVSYDLKRDIGLVSFAPQQAIVPVTVAAGGAAIRRGNSVFSIGCDRGAAPSVRQSRITAVDRYVGPPNIEVAGQPVVGRSGGGLFTTAGELIGICNFADPADDEGIYASLATIHWELDQIGQRRVYQPADPPETLLAEASAPATRSDRQPDTVPQAAVEAPPEPPRMPAQMPDSVAITPVRSGAPNAADDLEVICIVRSRSNPQAASRVLVVDRPSRELLGWLTERASGVPAGSKLAPVRGRRNRRAGPVVRAQSADR